MLGLVCMDEGGGGSWELVRGGLDTPPSSVDAGRAPQLPAWPGPSADLLLCKDIHMSSYCRRGPFHKKRPLIQAHPLPQGRRPGRVGTSVRRGGAGTPWCGAKPLTASVCRLVTVAAAQGGAGGAHSPLGVG